MIGNPSIAASELAGSIITALLAIFVPLVCLAYILLL